MKKVERIPNIHNNVFIKTFLDPENVRGLLQIALPEQIRNIINFSEIKIDPTSYISDEIKGYFSDVVVKTRVKTYEQKESKADIYILVEHKSTAENTVLIQVLKYMYLEWQKDIDKKKHLRVIIPMIFYHGKEKWKVPRSFVEQFKVNDSIKEFLLNYKYVLFDTKDWDFMDEANQGLKNNVFLLTALVLMKNAFNEDVASVKEIFKFWNEKGFTKDIDKMVFFLLYISATKDISPEKLKKMLEESNIKGGDIMPSLAQRWMDEGRKKGIETIVSRMYQKGISIEEIVDYSGISKKEIKIMINSSNSSKSKDKNEPHQ